MRLIDADRFEDQMNEELLPELIKEYGKEEALKGLHFSFRDCICNIQCQPTVDAVEVVRCKDCKWWELVDDYYAKGYGECTCPRSVIKRSTFLNEDWYCADGERREE